MKPHSALKGMVTAMIAKQQKTFNNTTKLIEEIYIQFNKIEVITIGLESRNKIVEDKYKSNF